MDKLKKNARQKRPGNAHALKHGAYARLMRLPDDIARESRRLTLRDELRLLRAATLTAVKKIGDWTLQLESGEPGLREDLEGRIAAAEKGVYRNISRIESLERTLSGLSVDAAQVKRLREVTEGLRAANASRSGTQSNPLEHLVNEILNCDGGMGE